MSNATPTGAEWQQCVTKLCVVQCKLIGEEYEPIPDVVKGDGGLEGVTTAGDGYQCYADQETVSVADRTRKQKTKIRDDLAKLEQRRTFWESYFGTRKLKRWFLVCPDVADKLVLTHAKKHAKILRDKKLPYIDDSFEAFVVTDSHFEMAHQWLAKNGISVVAIYPDKATASELMAFVSSKPKFIANIDEKLRKVSPNEDDDNIVGRRNKYLLNHLNSENVLAKLNNDTPEVRENLDSFIAAREHTVRFESDFDDSKPGTRLSTVHRSLYDDLSREFKGLSSGTVGVLALGAITAWLGECPLDFKVKGP